MNNRRYFILFFLLSCAIFLNGAFVHADETASLQAQPVEPKIRVLLAKTSDQLEVFASSSLSVVSNNVTYLTIGPFATVTIKYASGKYEIRSGDTFFATPGFVRLEPVDNGIITIKSLKRPLKGHGDRLYQTYRGVIEYRYSQKNKIPYLINELPLEQYLAGVTEIAPGDPTEYVKAITVAARTYAYVNINKQGSSNNNLFDVYATTQDQLYLGYESEARLPEVSAAASSTAGEMVLYQGQPVLTLYFGQSRGKTKTWPKPAARPWLKSVKTKYDSAKRASGHGYGISMNDARKRALLDAWDYSQILNYYYTSTTLERVY